MLPKITEGGRLSEEAKIQDFCASLHLTQDEESKEKLEVRSVFEQVDNDGVRGSRKPKAGPSINKPTRYNSTTTAKFKDGFSKAHVFSAAKATRHKENKQEIQENKLIDLTKMDDAKKLANRLIEDLRDYGANRIQTHLNRFENADLTFPKLWNRERLFHSANRSAHNEQRVTKSAVKATNRRLAANGKQVVFGERQMSNAYRGDCVRQFVTGRVFYSEPVHLKQVRHYAGKLSLVRSCPKITNIPQHSRYR